MRRLDQLIAINSLTTNLDCINNNHTFVVIDCTASHYLNFFNWLFLFVDNLVNKTAIGAAV